MRERGGQENGIAAGRGEKMKHSIRITRADNDETLYITSNIVGNDGDNVRLLVEKKDNGEYKVNEVPITVYDHEETERGMVRVSANVTRTDTGEEFLIIIDKSEHKERFKVFHIAGKQARPVPIDIGYIMVKERH